MKSFRSNWKNKLLVYFGAKKSKSIQCMNEIHHLGLIERLRNAGWKDFNCPLNRL